MTEAFLHYLFNKRKLGNHFVTTEGHALIVKDFGYLNKNAGPDFQESIVHFDNKVWAGHIEFHINSSDWIKHNHQIDKAYNNVVAHFVWKHDQDIFIDNYKLPVVELDGLIDPSEFDKYNRILSSKSWIPCSVQIKDIPTEIISEQISNSAIARLNNKSNEILVSLKAHSGDQKKVLFSLIAKVIGGKVNGDVMVKLIDKVNFDFLQTLDFNEFKIQALLHGLSGLLEETNSDDPYVLRLKNEFSYQKKLFRLTPLTAVEWKRSSMRPAGSPSNRIAQLSGILAKSNSPNVLENLKDLDFDNFWYTHLNFSRSVKKNNPQLSKDLVDLVKINALVPFNYALAILKNDNEQKKSQIIELKKIKAEKNAIIAKWNKIGVKSQLAFESQGLIEQKNKLCNEKKCLFCAVGKQLLNQ